MKELAGTIFIIVLLTLLTLSAIAYQFVIRKGVEKFEMFVSESRSYEQAVIDIFEEVLHRQPSPKELKQNTRSLQRGDTTIGLLKQRLIDSDENTRQLKTQSNDLTPELSKLISDRKLILTVAALYKKVKGEDIPPKLSLALKDLFAHLGYNISVFEAVLAAPQYVIFETDMANAKMLNRDRMLELFAEHYESFASEDPSSNPGFPSVLSASQLLGQAASPSHRGSLYAPEDTNLVTPTSHMPLSILNGKSALYDPDVASGSSMIPTQWGQGPSWVLQGSSQPSFAHFQQQVVQRAQQPISAVKLQQMRQDYADGGVDGNGPAIMHKNDMVLRPEFAWSVPQYHPPVCTTLGKPPLQVIPTLENSKLLLGTPLAEARDTAVGSIMPEFQYKQGVLLNKQAAA
jgi:hypothetical protein